MDRVTILKNLNRQDSLKTLLLWEGGGKRGELESWLKELEEKRIPPWIRTMNERLHPVAVLAVASL